MILRKKDMQRLKDEIIVSKTLKSTNEWIKILDQFNVKKKGYTKATKHLLENYDLNPKWAQTVVIRYEFRKGLRA
ncbi:MAG TPA: hypothetical protein VJJ23_02850 [Candidatus Nanoarchaeia archaeon]|nr:hypothetical protein [Candidatus Nanoarchaeia archaeon]